MAEELERLWGKLSFTEEEDEGIEIDSNCTRTAREIGKNCVLMKILAHKSISIEALRKNMRMLWKPNKNVQISEVDEDLFLVEFGDGRDKKKVLDMCPWSYEKQLVLLHEFDGKLTPREVEIKWAPFWVQIFNLPLNCRTKEIGQAIGGKLGEVLEIDVQESGVQWGMCLRVKVCIDVTKRLVRGKKITVEGEECRWVNFKYERLPNFCYRCGLLNHALRDCPENGVGNQEKDGETLQYGAWLRGDIMRRGAQDQYNMGMGRGKDADTYRWNAGAETEKRKVISRQDGFSVGVGEAHASSQPGLAVNPLTQNKGKDGEGVKVSDVLHEKGRGDGMADGKEEKRLVLTGEASNKTNFQQDLLHEKGRCDEKSEKKVEKKSIRVGEAADHEKSQFLETESMTWEKEVDQRKKTELDEKGAPIFGPTNGIESPHGLEINPGPIAMIYDDEKGWSGEKLGLNSRHWKRLAREGKKDSKGEEKGPYCLKREGPTPLCVLDPYVIDTKRRKEERNNGKKTGSNSQGEKKMDGGEAVAAGQHRRAS